ncbi:unnamed protein product, partial [Soboliphyme baturini]|uniref:MIF4G domain-containing protein n=1 Tax=Soboliphyme baturini TaxID=241478 RepID=A0A183ILW9_9BILA
KPQPEDDASRYRRKLELRQKNLAAASNRPDESFFRKLDSNLKKNTAFVKKLKSFTEQQRDSIVRDFGGLNLSKYAAEMASSITEAKLKLSDVPAVIDVCSLAHQRYADFAPALLDYFKKTFPRRKDEKIANISKFRVDLRLLAELILCGVLPEKEALSVLGAALNYLVQTDKEEHINLAIINTFCKYCGDDFAALALHRKRRAAASSTGGPTSVTNNTTAIAAPIINVDHQKKVYNLLCDYFQSLQRHVQRSQRELQKMERQNRWQYENKGEVHPDAVQRLDEAKANFDKLFANANMFAELLSKERFQMVVGDPTDGTGDATGSSGDFRSVVVQTGVASQTATGDNSVAESVWEDEDTRMFYETLPELRAMLPSILFKDVEGASTAAVAAAADVSSLVEDEVITESDEVSAVTSDVDMKELGPEDEKLDKIAPTESDNDDQNLVMSGGEDGDEAKLSEPPEAEDEVEGDKCSGSTLRQMMETFVSQLPNLINRDMIDQAAIDFVTNLNTKTNRKRLVKAMFNVHRTRLDLLPFYSRLVATLNPVMPDVGIELCKMLIANFRHQVRKKDQILIETKVKIVRFIGELVKFRIFPKSEALHCLKILLFDLRHHNIDMACNLLDSCGYFLYHSPDSYQKTKVLLEQMMRKRQAALHLDQRYQLMINNAYYTCNPPTAGSAGLTPKVRWCVVITPNSVNLTTFQIERTSMQEYIRKLVFVDLSKITVERVLVQIRKLDWDDPAVVRYAVHCLSQPWNVKYNCIQWLASLLAGIMYYYDKVGYQVVDNILEEIRIGMEVNHHKLNQRRICCMKYLGEMYNYRVVDSAIIFNVLYSLVTFGVVGEPKASSPIDPPEHLLRIRLACIVLDTCGAYFDRGTSRKKLDCYLLYLQRYWLMKKSSEFWSSAEHPFPAEVDYVFLETIEHLRHNFKPAESFEEASKKVKDLEAEYKSKVESALKFVQPIEHEVGECMPADDEEGEFAGPRRLEDADEEGGFNGGTTGSQDGASQGSREPRSLSQKDAWPVRLPNDDEEDTGLTVHWKNAETNRTLEDEDFMKEFDTMMAEMMQQRASDQLKVPQVEFTVPTNVRAKANVKTKFEDEEVKDEGVQSPTENNDTVNFYLMTKGKGSKLTLKTLKIPVSSDFALALKDREEAELREKEKMKQLTLDMSRRMEEEEIAEIEGSGPRAFSAADQKKANQQPRFQHQKGAPNPHEIFSNRWFR